MLPKILVVLLVLIGGVFGLKALEIYKQNIGGNPPSFGLQKCNEHSKFSVSPIKTTDLGLITPLGNMNDSHVTPTDHQYWSPVSVKFGSDNTILTPIYDIYALSDGTIVQAENHTQVYSDRNTPKIDDWRLVINHSCGVYVIYIHIDKLSLEILSKLGAKRESRNGTTNYNANIPVLEGQIIGRLAEHPFDFSIHDSNVTLAGFVNPKQYENEYWKIHTVDPFEYFASPIRDEILAKVVRTVEPRGGKIDYDIEGRLVGNWFREGYDSKNIDGRFWDAQMTIAYNNFDPSKIFISLGNFNGRSQQFVVAGNAPDPKNIGIGQLVKYELVSYSYVDLNGKSWRQDRYTPQVRVVPGNTEGVILYQLQDKNTLKVEIFVGKKATDVSGFSSNTQMYRR